MSFRAWLLQRLAADWISLSICFVTRSLSRVGFLPFNSPSRMAKVLIFEKSTNYAP